MDSGVRSAPGPEALTVFAIVCICAAGIGVAVMTLSRKKPHPAVAAEHAAMTREIASLTQGDLVISTDGRTALVVAGLNQGPLRLWWNDGMLGGFNYEDIASRTERIVRKDDTAWHEAIQRFFTK